MRSKIIDYGGKVPADPQIIKCIDSYLSDEGLKNPKLKILIPDSGNYEALLFQPYGDIEYEENNFVRNKNTDISYNKFKSFFDIACDKEVNLAVTPEYSCPWTVIRNLVKNDIFPQEGNLWIIGCESIKQDELNGFIEDYSDITWIYEKEVLTPIKKNKFLDPLCYFFKTRDETTDQLVNVIIIQFKTHQMAGSFERNNLILGKTKYILMNDKDSIYLFSLICSDALIFDMNSLPRNLNATYLIIHIQMNQKPFHNTFSKYRYDYFESGKKRREFICLNWARNSHMNDKLFSSYGGSALYTKSDKLDLKDDRILRNHDKGLYYCYWVAAYAHVYFFNYDEYVFYFSTSKPLQDLDPSQNQDDCGPYMEETYIWNGTTENKWELKNPDYEDCILSCGSCPIYCPVCKKNLSLVNVERLVALSTGKAICDNWIIPQNLKFFRTARTNKSNEVNRRLTFLQDPNKEIKSIKRQTMKMFLDLYEIIKEEMNFPEEAFDISKNCTIEYNPGTNFESYMFNLYSEKEENENPLKERRKASIAYVGDETYEEADDIAECMLDLFRDCNSRVIVWYGKTEDLTPIYKEKISYKKSAKRSRNSYLKTGNIIFNGNPT